MLKNSYLFDGQEFTEVNELDDPSSFVEQAILDGSFLYVFSKDGVLFCYDTKASTWDKIVINRSGISNRE
jgi:hypothetical protein